MNKINKQINLPGKILVTWFASGGILTGGMFVLYGLYQESIAHYMMFNLIGGLYMSGGLLGFLAGGALGMFGRPLGMKVFDAFMDQLKGVLYMILIGAVGFVASAWIVLTYWSAKTGSLLGFTIAGGGWLIAGLFFALALEYGWLGIRNLAGRVMTLGNIHIHIHFEEKKETQ